MTRTSAPLPPAGRPGSRAARAGLAVFALAALAAVTSAVAVEPTTYDPFTATGTLTLSDGNLTTSVTAQEVIGSGGVASVHSVSCGKYYWEVSVQCPVFDTLGFGAGVGTPDAILEWNDYFLGDQTWIILSDRNEKFHGSDRALLGGNSKAPDVLRFALDMDSHRIWFGRNGDWLPAGSGANPATGTNPAYTGLPDEVFATMMMAWRECTDPMSAKTNFGATPFAYSPPAGFNAGFGPGDPCAVRNVSVDIKPGSDPNSINLCSNGSVPVAIFGSATFSVLDIVTDTLRFAEASVKVVGKKDPQQLCSVEDLDGDGVVDLVCQYVTTDIAALDGESTMATVNGELFDGTRIEGTDSVNIVKDTCQ